MKSRYQVLMVGMVLGVSVFEAMPKVYAEGASTVTSPVKDEVKAKNSAQWRAKMQEIYKILAEIVTDSSSDHRFNAPENKSRIEKNAKKLADRAHDLSKKGLSPDADPTIKILAESFQDETKRAYWALKSGNRSYARSLLNQVTSYCIACHTRNNSGPSFSSLPFEPLKNLDSIEKGRFYAATRQYDRALETFQTVISDPSAASNRPLEWEQAVRNGLAISVRVKQNPDQALELVERVILAKKAPYFLKQDALKWKESLMKWKVELPTRALTEEGLHLESMQLVEQARELQKYPMDHAADVLYLRATATIHELLQKYPDGRHAQDALLMAGMCYDVLRPLSIEDIHEVYYESCIKKTPHTQTAEMCFRRYQQSTYEGYSGSSGTHLPEEMKTKLDELEALAHPEAKPVL